jgi:hypothetical protein
VNWVNRFANYACYKKAFGAAIIPAKAGIPFFNKHDGIGGVPACAE